MSLSTSLISAAQKLITAFGNDASLYSFSSAITSTNDEGDITVLEWLPSETIDRCDATTGWTGTDCTLASDTTTFKEGTGSIAFVKSGITVTPFTASKTISSLDLTSKEIRLYIYIKDAATLAKLKTTACFTLRIGDSSTVYYQWTKNKSDFSLGWNYLTGFTTATATLVGVPTITAAVYAYLGFELSAVTDVLVSGDLNVDMIILCSSATIIKVVDGGSEGSKLLSTSQGLEKINSDEKIIMNTVTVSPNDRLTYNGATYKIMGVRQERIESVDIIKIISVSRYSGTSPW